MWIVLFNITIPGPVDQTLGQIWELLIEAAAVVLVESAMNAALVVALTEKYPALVNRKQVLFQLDNAKRKSLWFTII